MQNLLRIIITASVFFMTTQGLAHDFWIEPSQFHPQKGRILSLSLRVGTEYEGEVVVRHPAHLKRFEYHQLASSNKKDIPGRQGVDPAGYFRFQSDKPGIVVYESAFQSIALKPKDFNGYLEEEGLLGVVAKQADSQAEIKERFRRFAKALIVPKNFKAKQIDRKLDLKIELVCLNGELTISQGKLTELTWQLFFDNQPLPNRRVSILEKASGKAVSWSVTDKQGKAKLQLTKPGIYMVKAINIRPTQYAQEKWESFWATSTFQLSQ